MRKIKHWKKNLKNTKEFDSQRGRKRLRLIRAMCWVERQIDRRRDRTKRLKMGGKRDSERYEKREKITVRDLKREKKLQF